MKQVNDSHELKNMVSQWVDTFNFIQLEVLEKMADSCLFEYIRQPEPDYEEFVNNYNLHKELLEYIQKDWDDVHEGINLFGEETFEESIKYFCEEEYRNEFETFTDERSNENYPMWNTCFEFKHEENEDVIQAAVDAGFGIIEGLEPFNTILFVKGCGYSFYGAHWIPMFLNLPWNTDIKKQVIEKGIEYHNL